jgi:mannosyl-oligosaccharide alpha-1,2-mannosidase
MKHFYILFSNTPRFDYQHNYLTTEGKVLVGLRPPAT